MSLNKYESIKIPILKKTEYTTWKVKMLMYLEATDPDYLDVINDGPFMPTKLVPATPTVAEHYQLKQKTEWTPEEKVAVLKDAKISDSAKQSVFGGKGKNNFPESDTDDSSSNPNDDTDSKTDENMTDSDVMQMAALLVKGFRRIQFRNSRNNRSFRKKFTGGEKKSNGRKDGNDSKAGKLDMTKIKCYNCDEPGHSECKKIKHDKGKSKALILSSKNWMDSSDSEDENTCYALMASLDNPAASEPKVQTPFFSFDTENISELKYILKSLHGSFKNKTLENDRLITEIKTLKSRNDQLEFDLIHQIDLKKECERAKHTVNILESRYKADEPKSTFEKGSTSVLQEKLVNDKTQSKKSKETIKSVKKEKNIGLLSARQLKNKISEVAIENVALVEGPKHNLLSISQITDRGYHVVFYDSHYEVVHNKSKKIVLIGYRHGNIYEARLHESLEKEATCLISKASVDESWNWHKKLSHLNFNSINELAKKELLGKFEPKADEGIFVGYSPSKAYRVFNLRTHTVVVSVNVSFDDKKIPGFEEDTHESLIFATEKALLESGSNSNELSNLDDPNPDTPSDFKDNHYANEPAQVGGSNNKGGASSSRRILPSARKWTKDHTPDLIIGNPDDGVKTRNATQNECLYHNLLSKEEPKKVEDALKDADWVMAMQEELNEFKRNKVWKRVPRPKNRSIVGTKWVFRNKTDYDGTIIRNKARLVAKGYSQWEGIAIMRHLLLLLDWKQSESS
ncbi:hypothetical protein AgCh_015791 [Apium graveolens]